VGALTRYETWVYGTILSIDSLKLGERYRWLSIAEMLDGHTAAGRKTGDPSLFRLINASLAGGLEQAPLSIRSEAVHGLREAVDSARIARRGVFIGHGRSHAWRELADHLRDHHGYPIVTIESEPRIGQSITEVLARMVEQASFAILVHTAEDEQADGTLRARQNVVHETGPFQGRLGFSRTIIVRQVGCEEFSNIAGLQEVRYSDDIREAFGHVVAALSRELE
jgi:predicted nucleotide-binding protein